MKMIGNLQQKIREGPLQIIEGKEEHKGTDEDDENDDSKGKELMISKTKETKQKKMVIVDPKVKRNLKQGATPPNSTLRQK